jgi:hypothetical protein
MPKFAVVTTFNAKGYKQYAQKFLRTFLENWPKKVDLVVYTENCVIGEKSDNLIVHDLHLVSEAIVNFKNKWQNVPKANGDISKDPIRGRRKDAHKKFKWDAVRFSHKVYSIFHSAVNSGADILIWMDADMICHSPITIEQICSLIPENMDLCYLGRDGKYPECGLYSLNLSSLAIKSFLAEFQRMYDDAEQGIFRLDEWHDSYVFEEVRKKFPNLKILSWSEELGDLRPTSFNSKGEGHPLINSEWGRYLDHLKGERKVLGKSQAIDLKVKRTESYWLNN